MPVWLKILLAVIVIGVVLVVVAGFLVVQLFQRGVAAAEEAGAEGKGFGFNNSLDACVGEGARRTGLCDDSQISCVMTTSSFLWGCVESADYDEAFCAKVPEAGDGRAAQQWGESACRAFGQPDNETCSFALQVIPSFCTYRMQNG